MEKKRIIFLVMPNVHLLDLAGPDQVFHEAIDMGAEFETIYCSNESALESSALLHISKLQSFEKVIVSKNDYVFIPGAEVSYLTGNSISKEKELLQWLNTAHQNGAMICSVCTGAYLLGKAGLLNNRECTTHWKHTEKLQQKFPRAKVVDGILFTEDSGVFTSAGVTSGIDLALYLIEKIKGEKFSFHVAREIVVYMRRNGKDAQRSVFTDFRNHIHSGIHRVQDLIEKNLHQKHTLESLAEIACMSPRNLTRIFKRETGITVNAYITLLRKENLQKLKHNPDITRKQMAELSGLRSERHVIRLLNATM